MDYCYEMTKDLKNIYYDTSAMADPEVAEATGGWNIIVDILKKTVELKPDNVMFGTDWPMCPVDKHIQLIKDLELDAKIEEKIFFLTQLIFVNLKFCDAHHITACMRFKKKCVNNFQRLHFFFHPNFASSIDKIIRKSAKLLIHANIIGNNLIIF